MKPKRALKKGWPAHPTSSASPSIKMERYLTDPDGFKRLISKDSCDGCKHLHFVQATPYGTSHDGWGCLMSGGHAVKRCQLFEEKS